MPPVRGAQSWEDLYADLRAYIRESESARGVALWEFIHRVEAGDSIALYDRNSLGTNDWRKVIVQKASGNSWILCDEHGAVLDEPDDGCARSGFTTDSFEGDLDAGFYAAASPEEDEEASDPDDDQDDAAKDCQDWDKVRARHKASGHVGTVRTREGSNDHTIPANKIMFLRDAGRGEHILIKHDDVQDELEILNADDDNVPPLKRASRLLKGSKATIIEGTLIGAVNISFSDLPADHVELELFAGVILKERKLAMGAKVFARVACSAQRPNNEFYLAAIARARKTNQYHMNAKPPTPPPPSLRQCER